MKKQIICLGGGGLDDKNPFLDLYILAQTNKVNPKVCLLPTPAGDNLGLCKYFMELYENFPCRPSYLTLFNPHTSDIKDYLMEQDMIFVSGGQSKSALGVFREWGLDKFLFDAYENGTVLSGTSAGSVIWNHQCITDSFPPDLTVMPALGYLPFSNCPHFGSKERRIAFRKFREEGKIVDGYAASDHSGLHFLDSKLLRSVSLDSRFSAFEISMKNEKYSQKRLKSELLCDQTVQSQLIFNSPTFQ